MHIQIDRYASDVSAPHAPNQYGNRDGTRLGRELPTEFIDLPQITLGKSQRLAIIEDEGNRAARHRGSIAGRYLNRSSRADRPRHVMPPSDPSAR
jgi:hypothetical protein